MVEIAESAVNQATAEMKNATAAAFAAANAPVGDEQLPAPPAIVNHAVVIGQILMRFKTLLASNAGVSMCDLEAAVAQLRGSELNGVSSTTKDAIAIRLKDLARLRNTFLQAKVRLMLQFQCE